MVLMWEDPSVSLPTSVNFAQEDMCVFNFYII